MTGATQMSYILAIFYRALYCHPLAYTSSITFHPIVDSVFQHKLLGLWKKSLQMTVNLNIL